VLDSWFEKKTNVISKPAEAAFTKGSNRPMGGFETASIIHRLLLNETYLLNRYYSGSVKYFQVLICAESAFLNFPV